MNVLAHVQSTVGTLAAQGVSQACQERRRARSSARLPPPDFVPFSHADANKHSPADSRVSGACRSVRDCHRPGFCGARTRLGRHCRSVRACGRRFLVRSRHRFARHSEARQHGASNAANPRATHRVRAVLWQSGSRYQRGLLSDAFAHRNGDPRRTRGGKPTSVTSRPQWLLRSHAARAEWCNRGRVHYAGGTGSA